ncbi:MAG: hypothetical protein GXY52_06755 [Chloroflexi bacterium]|nr:hypothetical protein [Chloroflexota bacterium]
MPECEQRGWFIGVDLHARVAARLAALSQYSSANLVVTAKGRQAEAASVTDMLLLGISAGSHITLCSDMPLPDTAWAEMLELLQACPDDQTHWQGCGLSAGEAAAAPSWLPPMDKTGAVVDPIAHLNGAQLALARELYSTQASGAAELTELLEAERQLLEHPRLGEMLAGTLPSGAAAMLIESVRARLLAQPEALSSSPCILLKESVQVSELLEAGAGRIAAVVCGTGAFTSHSAIAARALGIPMVAGFGTAQLAAMAQHPRLYVDGARGIVRVARANAHVTAPVQVPPQPKLVCKSGLWANGDSPAIIRQALADGAAGIGLVRAEQWRSGDADYVYGSASLPGELIELARSVPIIWRVQSASVLPVETLCSWARQARGTRLAFALAGVRTADAWLAWQAAWQRAAEPDAPSPQGVLIEVPALADDLERIAPRADFVSIGSNDLAAHYYALDRDDPAHMLPRATLQPGFWRLMARIAECARQYRKPLYICGEAAGLWPEALLFDALGMRLSVAPHRLVPIARQLEQHRSQAMRAVEAILSADQFDDTAAAFTQLGIRVHPEVFS